MGLARRTLRKIARLAGLAARLVLWAVVALALAIGVAESPPGKQALARLATRLAAPYLRGRLELGSIHGDLARRLSLHDIRVFDRKGRLAVRIARASARYALKLRPLRLEIHDVTLEQPELLVDDPRVLLARARDDEGEKKKPTGSDDSEKSRVVLRRARVAEGRYLGVHPINVDVELPETLDRLPEGRVFAAGELRGLPLKLVLTVGRVPAAPSGRGRGSGTLSGVAKGDVELRQIAAVVARWGCSRVELHGEGTFDPARPERSTGELVLPDARYEGRELHRAWKGAPEQTVEARGSARVRDRAVEASLETHLENKTRVVVAGRAGELPSPQTILLRRVELTGECPLLVLERATSLRLGESGRQPLPLGKLALKGCAGDVRYERDAKMATLS
ncbi:MAG: hypothetical protein HY075_06195, partial [Deltaproteobacteria bacterium]|nr:hypothetical protein [Deltaproteobacteria bacterium]